MNIRSKTVILSLSIGYGLTKQWIQNQEIQQELIRDKLTTQLKYLKAQINPHFLFNTLNMAYASATKSNDAVTADIIEKLSGLSPQTEWKDPFYIHFSTYGRRAGFNDEIKHNLL